jgi:hypothetical protein
MVEIEALLAYFENVQRKGRHLILREPSSAVLYLLHWRLIPRYQGELFPVPGMGDDWIAKSLRCISEHGKQRYSHGFGLTQCGV